MEKKNVLLLGDSLRLGYCNYAREALSDEANVYFPEDNCRCTQYTYVSIYRWRDALPCPPEEVAIVHWNCGQWDAMHYHGDEKCLNTPEQYADMIGRIDRTLRKAFPNARICFATTTPMNPNGQQSDNPRTTQEITLLNEKALALMEKRSVPVDDLFAAMRDKDTSWYKDACHLTEEGYRYLGGCVADFIRRQLAI